MALSLDNPIWDDEPVQHAAPVQANESSDSEDVLYLGETRSSAARANHRSATSDVEEMSHATEAIGQSSHRNDERAKQPRPAGNLQSPSNIDPGPRRNENFTSGQPNKPGASHDERSKTSSHHQNSVAAHPDAPRHCASSSLARRPCSPCCAQAGQCEAMHLHLYLNFPEPDSPLTFSLGCALCVRTRLYCPAIPNDLLPEPATGAHFVCKTHKAYGADLKTMRVTLRRMGNLISVLDVQSEECERSGKSAWECEFWPKREHANARRLLVRMPARQRAQVRVVVEFERRGPSRGDIG